MAVNGTALGVASVGALLLYSAVKGAGIADTARSLLTGQPLDTSTPTGSMVASGVAAGTWATVNPGSGGQPVVINGALKQQGYTRAQRAGIMGNMQIESGFDPTAVNEHEGAIGICQWEGGRRTALRTYAKSLGKDETDLSAQLAFFRAEMSTAFAPVHALIKASKSPARVATIVDAGYEISSGSSRQARISAANSLYASEVTQ